MGHKLRLLFCISVLFSFLPASSFAGLIGSKHDMFAQGKGTSQALCSYCHVPHNAAGDKIWSTWANEAQLTSGPSTKMGNMCYTCHDGTVTSLGTSSVFNSTFQSHKIPSGQDCDMCHSVHDNTNAKFMKVAVTQDSYCASCHNTTVNAGGLGDYTGQGNHQSYWDYKPAHDLGGPGQGNGVPTPTGPVNSCGVCHWQVSSQRSTDGSCNLCHRVHGTLNLTAPTTNYPILKDDNTDSAYCAKCHTFVKQTTINGQKHPSYMSGKVLCKDCHDVHRPGSSNPHLLVSPNTNSQMCIDCHDGAKAKGIGHSHPYGAGFGSAVPQDSSAATGTPPANMIDDDGEGGPDYPSNTGDLVCETCHGMHRKVDDAGTKLLRITNTGSNLCKNCHTDK